MKILLVNKFNHTKGGADKYFLDLADLLKENGVEVAKFCMDHPDNLTDENQDFFVSNIDFNKFSLINTFKYIGRIIYSLEAKKKFGKLLDKFNPDIIHIHNIYHQISPSILHVAKRRSIPVIMHLHDYKLMCPNYQMFNQNGICEKCKGGKYYHCAVNKCLKKSFFKSLLAMIEMYIHHKVLKIYEKNIDLYIAPTEFMAKKAAEWGVDKEKIVVQSYFIHTNQFEVGHENKDFFLYWGRLSEEKGVDVLVRAMTLVNKNIKLKIYGTGPVAYETKKLVRKLDLEDRVEMHGARYGREMMDIVRDSFAVVLPSKWYEVFGIVNIEASIMAKPVIATNIGGIGEAILDEKTGLLFDINDEKDLAKKIEDLYQNQDKAKSLGESGRQFVLDTFGEGKHLKNIIKIYNDVSKN